MPTTRYNREGGRPGNPTTNSLRDGGLGLRPNVREYSPRIEDGGEHQERVVPQVGSYAGLPMSAPGNAGRSGVPNIFGTGKKSRLPKRQPVTRQSRESARAGPPPGLDGMPEYMYDDAWKKYLDPTIKGIGTYSPANDVGIKEEMASLASLKTAEDEAPFAPRARPRSVVGDEDEAPYASRARSRSVVGDTDDDIITPLGGMMILYLDLLAVMMIL